MPFALAALVIASPFIGVYYLGAYMKARRA